MKIIDFKVGEGQTSKMYVWDDVRSDAKGVIQLVHGMAEHMGRYHAFAKFLNRNGYFVYGLDNRGHGLNTDMLHLGWDEGDMWSNDIADQLLLTEYINVQHPGLQIILHGHSYGSFVAQAYMQYNKRIAAFVLSGSTFMKGLDVWFGRRVANMQYRRHGDFVRAKTMAKLTFDMYQSKMNGNGSWLTSDSAEAEKYKKDPRTGYVLSTNFYKHFLKGVKSLYTKTYAENLDKQVPLYLYAGSDDHVGKQGVGVQKLFDYYKSVGMQNVTMKLYEGGRHEMLKEINRDEVFADVLEYFDSIVK